MKIWKVIVKFDRIEVKYERKSGFCTYKYKVAPKKVFDFMRAHDCVVKRNGDYVYRLTEKEILGA